MSSKNTPSACHRVRRSSRAVIPNGCDPGRRTSTGTWPRLGQVGLAEGLDELLRRLPGLRVARDDAPGRADLLQLGELLAVAVRVDGRRTDRRFAVRTREVERVGT